MKLLIVEDDENKRVQLTRFITERFLTVEICVAKSFQSGLKAIIEDNVDLVILDMTLPTFDIGIDEDGGRPQIYAGREILRQIDRRKILVPVVVVTQFETFGEGGASQTLKQLNEELERSHPKTYIGAIYYNAAYEGWKEELANTIGTVGQRRMAQ